MIILVATTSFVLYVETNTRNVTVIEYFKPEYYGISWFRGSSSITLSHSGIDNGTLKDLETYATSEQGWVSFDNRKTETFLSQPHQILCCSDGRVVCTNTGRNRLVAIDLRLRGHFQEAGISERRWDRLSLQGPFGDHLNSVFEHEGKLYAIAHGHSTGSCLAVFSYPELALLSITPVPARTGLHNVFVTDSNQILSCHSEAGALIDIKNGALLWEAGSPVYTRGMAATDELIVLGESVRTGRDLRRGSMSGLWFIDRRTHRAIDYMALGPFGAVNEVRIADEPDLAHHGVPLVNPEKLLLSAPLDDVRKQKMLVANNVLAARQLWSGFELVFGSPETTNNGWKSAGGTLCLAVKVAGDRSPWEVDYEIDVGGHLSFIFDYQGKGGDNNMVAFLLQPGVEHVTLTIWEEAGSGWAVRKPVRTHALPSKGRLAVSQVASAVTLKIDGRKVFSGTVPSAGRVTGVSGIRWTSSTVRPVQISAR
ncbi:hypothetical protein FJ987_10820 [Mesorhizobium sp. CU2]|uniref:hypothetical protein n=1 Tax=unclassified Mesorhizobium TaxID=325217 RepID=UPI0011275AA3|nr:MULTISPECIES: hypothetical protein [unclassified Mesorhizobium]TPN82700.1 hypothetical protein FJ988_16265 [Mesorhizobium sp. CU3]TPO16425.1 hypothetical protein FJ987_10820 [Mesorhizobium sp. CU2]